MRSIPSLFIVALIISFFSCSKGDTPKSITEKFLSSVSKEDFDAAKAYGTEDTDRLLDMMSSFQKMGTDPFLKDAKFDVYEEKISGDAATVKVKVEGHTNEQLFKLSKENGKWKVAMTKETINDSEANIFNLGATSTDTTSAN